MSSVRETPLLLLPLLEAERFRGTSWKETLDCFLKPQEGHSRESEEGRKRVSRREEERHGE
jgi:hypothetical protein